MAQDTVIARLSGLDTCVVSDALDRLVLRGVPLGLRPVTTGGRIAASVVTMRLKEDDGGICSRHLGVGALEQAGPGQAIVVANAGRRDIGAWGGLLSAAAVRRAVAGVIVDGACRDVDEIRVAGLSVFAMGVTPVTARGRVVEDSIQEPIVLGGIAVRPDDLVLADGSGVVFIPRARAGQVLDVACELRDREHTLRQRIRAGQPLAEVLDRRYNAMIKGGHDA